MKTFYNIYGPTGMGKTTTINNIVEGLSVIVGIEKQRSIIGILDDYKFSTMEQLLKDTEDYPDGDINIILITEKKIDHEGIMSAPFIEAMTQLKKGMEQSLENHRKN